MGDQPTPCHPDVAKGPCDTVPKWVQRSGIVFALAAFVGSGWRMARFLSSLRTELPFGDSRIRIDSTTTADIAFACAAVAVCTLLGWLVGRMIGWVGGTAVSRSD